MSSGELRERVRFERRREAGDDGYGNIQYEWQTVAGPMPARIRPESGSEEILAQRLAGANIQRITVRSFQASRGLDPGDRCVDERSGSIYNIRSIINPDERDRYVEITAEAGVAT